MTNSYEIILSTELESRIFARNLAETLKKGDIITLTGDLGTGKTFLCREIIRYFCGIDAKVVSPTFNLLQTYQAPNFNIYHFDLYRLKSQNELYELGIEDAFQNDICLIEWPQIVEAILPGNLIKISLEIITNNQRKCIVSS
jgi:tRNA threonylcarbamoyladenosine biosynthesis protein TsaE